MKVRVIYKKGKWWIGYLANGYWRIYHDHPKAGYPYSRKGCGACDSPAPRKLMIIYKLLTMAVSDEWKDVY